MDTGSKNRKGAVNLYSQVDLVRLAIEVGATFVGRSFSGDKAQLVPLLKAAISHRGFALLDVISPCVTFNNHDDSTKSYAYFREHNRAMPVDFVPMRQEITASYDSGSTHEVCMHDGSVVRLHKVDNEYDIESRHSALEAVAHYASEGKMLTGLLYIDREGEELHDTLGTARRPLNSLSEEELCPGSKFLNSINAGLR